jgi:hypothetical protein
MIIITLSQVLCTRLVWPPHRGDNGWLVVDVIALLVIIWFIIFKRPSWWHELQVIWSRLWSKNSKMTIFSFNVLMFLCPLFSLNCLIIQWVKTWHHPLCRQNRRKAFFSLETFCCQSHPPMWGVFNLMFLAYAWWCYDTTSNELWTLDYDNIPLQKVQFLPIAFNGDILSKLPHIHLNVHKTFPNARHG